MTQSILCIITAIMVSLAPLFNWQTTTVPEPENLASETEPSQEAYRTYDRVDGVENSVFYIARPKADAYKTVNASDFGLSAESEDNYDAFCRAIDFCRQNPNTRLVVEAGKYYFRTARAIELGSLKNILIDADGAEFYFENPYYFNVNDGDCVEIRGLTIKWNLEKSRLGSIVKVKNVRKLKKTFEIEFTELEDVSEEIPVKAFTQYDPETLTPGVRKNFKESYVYSDPEIITSVEKTGRNVLKITHNGKLKSFKNGDVFLLRHYVYDGNVFNVYNTENITFENVKIYGAAGMGWLIEGRSQRFQLLGCVVGLDPEHENDHRVSATADAVHIANTNGHFRISGCDFSFMGDDCVNVHDNLLCVTKRVSDRAVEYYTNANSLRVGDTAVFNGTKFESLGFSAKVTAVDDKTIAFDRELPDEITEGCIIYNGSLDSGNYVISGNYFHENRARGLLLQSDNGLCENNRFYKTMANPIKIIMDLSPGLWLEGTGVNCLAVRNNTFDDCNVVDWGAQIEISADISGNQAAQPMFFNITVENNTFKNFPGNVLRAANTSGLSFNGNTVMNFRYKTELNRGRVRIKESCSKVTVGRNIFVPSVKAPNQNLVDFENIKSVL